MSNLETKFGGILDDLKNDLIIDVNMEHANIGDSEIRALASILKNTEKLKKLTLKKNRITDRGLSSLLDSLTGSNVEVVDLSYNKITPVSFNAFKNFKIKNQKLRYVNLKNNDIPISLKRKKASEFSKIGLIFDF